MAGSKKFGSRVNGLQRIGQKHLKALVVLQRMVLVLEILR